MHLISSCDLKHFHDPIKGSEAALRFVTDKSKLMEAIRSHAARQTNMNPRSKNALAKKLNLVAGCEYLYTNLLFANTEAYTNS
jgi:hypothetical protein